MPKKLTVDRIIGLVDIQRISQKEELRRLEDRGIGSFHYRVVESSLRNAQNDRLNWERATRIVLSDNPTAETPF